MEYEKEDPKDYLLSVERQRRDAIARIAELTADLKAADRAALELSAEVARYKAALEKISEVFEKSSKHVASFTLLDFSVNIARNALKDGV
jgi:hypothetical protein